MFLSPQAEGALQDRRRGVCVCVCVCVCARMCTQSGVPKLAGYQVQVQVSSLVSGFLVPSYTHYAALRICFSKT